MKLFSAAHVRNWDAYTIAHEPIHSIDLMERAAAKCFDWIRSNYTSTNSFIIFCGTGNNGGDGLALARMLQKAGYTISVFIADHPNRSIDFTGNLEKLAQEPVTLQFIKTKNDFPVIEKYSIVIDALFGTGLNRPLEGTVAELVNHINNAGAEIISIDIPSGLFPDHSSIRNTIITATHTLSFQQPKLAFLLPENESCTGEVQVLDIALHQQYYTETSATFFVIDKALVTTIYKPRKNNTHKYSYGHALLYAGSRDMMGAAILCSKACLRSGAGLVTIHTNETTQPIIQIALPEAITSTTNDFDIITHKKTVIGIGPGLDASAENSLLLQSLINKWNGPLVIDATALQLLVPLLPDLSIRQYPTILTPHTGEFEKLFGKTKNDFERIQLALDKAASLHCFIILKGHHSFIACPDGKGFFNTTGNPGMATAGSGDTLTGIITGLLAQGYTAEESCILSVYLHGMAGDIAAGIWSKEAMIASDIIDHIGNAFKQLFYK